MDEAGYKTATQSDHRFAMSDMQFGTFPYKYRALNQFAFSPTVTASYAIPVRQASGLPSASFRFRFTTDTLAVRLTVPLVGPVADLHRQVIRPPPRVLE